MRISEARPFGIAEFDSGCHAPLHPACAKSNQRDVRACVSQLPSIAATFCGLVLFACSARACRLQRSGSGSEARPKSRRCGRVDFTLSAPVTPQEPQRRDARQEESHGQPRRQQHMRQAVWHGRVEDDRPPVGGEAQRRLASRTLRVCASKSSRPRSKRPTSSCRRPRGTSLSVWTQFATLRAPNSMIPRNTASRKKAVITS